MNAQLLKLRDALIDSFWFIPGVMALLSIALVIVTLALDRSLGTTWNQHFDTIWISGPADARNVLGVIVTATMTVISIVFSVTITALAQTSSHYGPRVLRNFTSDRVVQTTFGTFVATFLYSLLAMRAIHSGHAQFVPHISVNVGVLLSIISLGAVVFFINHIAHLIQAENLIADVGEEFHGLVSTLFPTESKENERVKENTPTAQQWQDADVVTSGHSGYLLHIDYEQLIKLATKLDLKMQMQFRPGDFIAAGRPVARVISSKKLSAEFSETVLSAFSFGWHRTPSQDALYSIQQMVEIAVHAMSPAINEPFTAITCVDWLGASLREVVVRGFPDHLLYGTDGQMCIVTKPVTFGEMLHTAFDQIRLYGAQNKDVLRQVLAVIDRLVPDIKSAKNLEEMRLYTQLIQADCEQIVNPVEREKLQKQSEQTLRVIADRKTAIDGEAE